jgi:glutathione S-transferase
LRSKQPSPLNPGGQNGWALTRPRRFHSSTLKQWDILEKQLSKPGQEYIAVANRPTLADLAYFPFAMPWMFTFLGVDVKDWPRIQQWADKMSARPAFNAVLESAPKIGHE